MVASPGPGPLTPLLQELDSHPLVQAHPGPAERLRARLRALDSQAASGAEVGEAAAAAIHDFQDSCWDALSEPARDTLLGHAREALADLADLVDEARLATMIDARARAHFRDQAPGLSASRVHALLHSPRNPS